MVGRKTVSIEAEIVDLFKRDDMRCIELIKEYYYDSLNVLAYSILRDDNICKDIMQQSLIKVWKNYSRYDKNKSSLYTWLYRIVKNTSLDMLRLLVRERGRYIRDEITLVDNFTSSSINTDLLDLDIHLKTLPFKYRLAIHLFYIEGFTHEQISKSLGIPLGTVKGRVKIGLRELRKIYLN